MNWLTEFVRPKIRTLFARREVPENLWHQCPACQQMIFHRDLLANLKVCPHCAHHMRVGALERLAFTFDEASYTRIELPKVIADPLRFRDTKRYTDRLKEARDRTHLDDAIVVAHGRIDGQQAVVAAMEFEFIGGSMGAAVGDGIVAAARLAMLQDAPLIVFTASGGARMQEGTISLMQMPRTIIATRMVKEAGLPYLVVLTDPTTGGVTASFPMLGDIHIAEPGALIGFAGPRVIEQTVREKLPEGFQRAEYLHEHGIVDMVVKRTEMKATLARVISLLRVKLVEPLPVRGVSGLPQPAGTVAAGGMMAGITEALKNLAGLAGLAYIAGFIVTNARFLTWGVGEADLLDARYIAAGAIFLFVAIPATLFPYLRGLARLNDLHMQVRKSHFSPRLHMLFDENRNFIAGVAGQFVVITALLTALPLFFAGSSTPGDRLTAIVVFALWYFGSFVLFRLAANLFNLRFYWRANMLLGRNGFWAAFRGGFIPHFRTSFARSIRLATGRQLTTQEIDDGMTDYVLRGLGSAGLLASSLYKAVALLLISATTFGVFVYPALPASIGGGQAQTVTLLLAADKSPGLVQLGVPGRQIPVARTDTDRSPPADKPAAFQLLTAPLALLAKTSEGYFILLPAAPGPTVIKIPSANVEAVAYGARAGSG